MKIRQWKGWFFLGMFTLFPVFASASIDPNELLRRIDTVRSIRENFAFEMRIATYENGELVVENEMVGYVKVDALDNSTAVLVYFLQPASVRGRKMFMDGKYIWQLFPRTRNIIRLSPLQILLGEVSYADILRMQFSAHYTVTNLREDSFEGHPAYVMSLSIRPEKRGTSYANIKIAVRKRDLQVMYAEFYTEGGKLLRTARYRNPQSVMGAMFPMEVEIRDGRDKEKYSVIRYTRIMRNPIPNRNYNKDFLFRFRPVGIGEAE